MQMKARSLGAWLPGDAPMRPLAQKRHQDLRVAAVAVGNHDLAHALGLDVLADVG